jgi:hypothetical protein
LQHTPLRPPGSLIKKPIGIRILIGIGRALIGR